MIDTCTATFCGLTIKPSNTKKIFLPRIYANVRELEKELAKIRAICGKGFAGLI